MVKTVFPVDFTNSRDCGKRIQMVEQVRTVVISLLEQLAPRLVELGIDYGVFSELAKVAYVRAAAKTSKKRNGRVNQALISIKTGVNRKDVPSLLAVAPRSEFAGSALVSRLMQVWRTDARFATQSKTCRPLLLDDEKRGFPALVRATASDSPTAAVLTHLVKIGLARISAGRVIEASRKQQSQYQKNRSSIETMLQHLHSEVLGIGDIGRVQQSTLQVAELRTDTQVKAAALYKESNAAFRRAIEEMERSVEGAKYPGDSPTNYVVQVRLSTFLKRREHPNKTLPTNQSSPKRKQRRKQTTTLSNELGVRSTR